MIVLASTQRNIGIVVAIIVALPAVILGIRRLAQIFTGTDEEVGAEVELAANRKPYLSDEELETTKLDQSLFFGLGLLVLVSVALPFYWIAEPGRQEGAVLEFDRIARVRGEASYAASCTACHGAGGGAGQASVTLTDDNGAYVAQVNWAAPALTTVLSRYTEDEVKFVLNYGRNGVMPAWGGPGGGPLTEQQIDNLVVYLRSVQLPPEEVVTAVDDGVRAGKRELIIDEDSELAGRIEAAAGDAEATAAIDAEIDAMIEEFLAVAQSERAQNPDSPDYDKYLEWGSLLFNNRADSGVYGCARCHTAGWSYNATEVLGLDGQPIQDEYVQGGGSFGANLRNGVLLDRFETAESHAAFISAGGAAGERYGSNGAPGQGAAMMPGFAARTEDNLVDPELPPFEWAATLSPEQIDAIVALERSWTAEAEAAGTDEVAAGTEEGGDA